MGKRKLTRNFACVAVIVALGAYCEATAHAQCNRGGGRMSTGNVSTLNTSGGFPSAAAQFSSLGNSPESALLAARYRTQAAQYQMLAQQQQRAMQMMMARQQALQRQLQAERNQSRGDNQLARGRSNRNQDRLARSSESAKERRRRQNAERMFQLANSAEADGRRATAKANYERVIRIVGAESSLGEQAVTALAGLGGNSATQTLLVSNEL